MNKNSIATMAPAANGNLSVAVYSQEHDGTAVVVPDAFSQGRGWMVIHHQADWLSSYFHIRLTSLTYKGALHYTHIKNIDCGDTLKCRGFVWITDHWESTHGIPFRL